MSDKVVNLSSVQPKYFNVVDALRGLATEIESGALGEVRTCAIVILSSVEGEDGMEVFGMGPRSSEFDVAGALRLGEQDMLNAILLGGGGL